MSSPEPTIRHATREDVPHILNLINLLAAYEKASSSVHATASSLLSTLSFPPFPSPGYARTLLIYPPPNTASGNAEAQPRTAGDTDADPPAGMALYYHTYSTWRAAPGIWLEDLFVKPEYRGKGYGTRLISRLAREVRELGGETAKREGKGEGEGKGNGDGDGKGKGKGDGNGEGNEKGEEGGRLEWCVLKWNKPSLDFYESEGIGAKQMDEWVSMRVEGPGLVKLAERDGSR